MIRQLVPHQHNQEAGLLATKISPTRRGATENRNCPQESACGFSCTIQTSREADGDLETTMTKRAAVQILDAR